jgi:uncharacterized repeat protein (TIGR01451 family)
VDTFDLALRKRVVSQSDSPLAPGVSTVTFSIEVFNQGDVAASNVTVIDYVPAGLVFEPSINPGWSGSPNPTTVIAGPLQPGQSATVQIVLRVARGHGGADDQQRGGDRRRQHGRRGCGLDAGHATTRRRRSRMT